VRTAPLPPTLTDPAPSTPFHPLPPPPAQYLIEDLFFTTVSASLMGFTRPRSRLSSVKPLPRVLSWPLMLSTLLQLLIVVAFQLIALAALRAQPGYVRTLGPPTVAQVVAPENSTIYLVSLAQFVILALVFNKGRPHRAPLGSNPGLVAALLAQGAWLLYSLFAGGGFNAKVQQLVGLDSVVGPRFRALLLALVLANLVVAYLAELLCAGLQWGVRRSKKGARQREAQAAAESLLQQEQRSQQPPAFL
jgi:cation-transporting ATPase 13A2